MNQLKQPKGFEDIAISDASKKRYIEQKIAKNLTLRGYEELYTPMVEHYHLFDRYENILKPSEAYKLIDPEGEVLILRPDMTLPMIRFASTKLKNEKVAKLFYMTQVVRKTKSDIERQWERSQIGAEVIGMTPLNGDVEIISTAIETLQLCGIDDFILELGHVDFLKTLLIDLNLTEAVEKDILKALHDKNMVDLENTLKNNDVCKEMADILVQLLITYGPMGEVLDRMKGVTKSKNLNAILTHLEDVLAKLTCYGYEKHLTLDLGLVQDLPYYSGVIFKGMIKNNSQEILSGGRYDNLIQSFGAHLYGSGFAVHFSRILPLIEPPTEDPCAVLYVKDINNQQAAFVQSEAMRREGMRVEIVFDLKEITLKTDNVIEL